MTIDKTLLTKTLFALGIGGIGGLIANWLTMPLPWMLGPMVVCTIASLLKLPVNGPNKIRPAMITILGVMLGSGFSPDMLQRAGEWTISLALLAAYVGLGGALCYPYFRKIAGYDRPTAYFAAMPGGLNEMMVIGHEMGGDDRRIVLTHASRVLLTVLCIPIFFRLTMHIDMADRSRFGVALTDVSLQDYLLLTSCILGYPAAKYLRIPAPMLVGPMLASAALHLSGTTATQPPIVIVSLAQWVMGTVIGCRFAGIARREVLRTIAMSVGSTAILLGLTAVFAVFVSWLAGIPVISVVLAYAPGGLAEMSLVALALGTDVAFVATHHIVRIVYVIIAAPMAYRAWMKRLSKTGG
ncbi:AbrB family transcriptional regulator [Rhodospirillaceae bacterium KN72]|uniref:AbrB family transcriptional regulator n=1 Tax=Pacificispira spongiicola TaxID=2729598 RepID=A0A7Y0HHY7_9PROT|nr:AbrB family transcriptional regulator [Pacificispira spongiicola]NMM46387.1 AbrB family transcriptional regulator [Pacificispira spongiicola]